MKTISFFLILGFFCCFADASNITIADNLDICATSVYSGLATKENLLPVVLQSSNYGQGLYEAGKSCSIVFENLISNFKYFIIVDYIALAVGDSLTIQDSNNQTL